MEPDSLSPEERELLTKLEEVIYEELRAQIAMERLDNKDGDREIASLIADMVFGVFELKKRERFRY